MTARRLDLSFDPDRLAEAVASIDPELWVPHYNAADYEGRWSVVALRSVDGSASSINADPSASGAYLSTPLLDEIPYFRTVLDTFRCPLDAVRLMRLEAGSSIREHRDLRLSRTDGEVRIHVPITTAEAVAFYVDGRRVRMRPGEAWYLDLSLPHRVENRSTLDRIHLVIDCVVDEWLDALLGDASNGDRPDGAVVRMAPNAARWTATDDAAFHDSLTGHIVDFLRGIGFEVVRATFDADVEGVVPGVLIDRGTLVVDADRLRRPGDLLHEAGHLAILEPEVRARTSGTAGADGGHEMAAIAWSYAAALHLGLDPVVVFHEEGYRGDATTILENFAAGRYIGVPVLQWVGLAADDRAIVSGCAAPYPAMLAWLRTDAPAPDESPAPTT